jgi:DNA mismatch endonuclease, patch repair protein
MIGAMADFMSPEQRSAHMAKIHSKNTKPELRLRRQLHAAGYRYRLHDRRLPGRPDLVFASRRKVVFVHGCFWHGHSCSIGSRLPKSNTQFWADKRHRNQERDKEQQAKLQAMGWKSLVVWECEINADPRIVEKVMEFLAI